MGIQTVIKILVAEDKPKPIKHEEPDPGKERGQESGEKIKIVTGKLPTA